jgi:tetratricopeptide (TPR) repeat protein
MNHYSKVKVLSVILTLLVFVGPRIMRSQEQEIEAESAALNGKVVNVEKKPIENAQVNLRNTTTGKVTSTKANKKGEFSFRRLFAGKYEITVEREGYTSYTGQLEIKEGSSPKVEVTLAVELTAEQKKEAEAVGAFKKGADLFKEKKTEEAMQEFQKAIDLKPDFFEAYLNKGILLFQSMKDEEAEKCILKAQELKPDDPKPKEILANIYFEQAKTLLENDKLDEALEKLKVVSATRPDYPYLNFLFGYAYYKKNVKEDAIKHFELFLQQEPNSPQVAQVKALLEELKKK